MFEFGRKKKPPNPILLGFLGYTTFWQGFQLDTRTLAVMVCY